MQCKHLKGRSKLWFRASVCVCAEQNLLQKHLSLNCCLKLLQSIKSNYKLGHRLWICCFNKYKNEKKRFYHIYLWQSTKVGTEFSFRRMTLTMMVYFSKWKNRCKFYFDRRPRNWGTIKCGTTICQLTFAWKCFRKCLFGKPSHRKDCLDCLFEAATIIIQCNCLLDWTPAILLLV